MLSDFECDEVMEELLYCREVLLKHVYTMHKERDLQIHCDTVDHFMWVADYEAVNKLKEMRC